MAIWFIHKSLVSTQHIVVSAPHNPASIHSATALPALFLLTFDPRRLRENKSLCDEDKNM